MYAAHKDHEAETILLYIQTEYQVTYTGIALNQLNSLYCLKQFNFGLLMQPKLTSTNLFQMHFYPMEHYYSRTSPSGHMQVSFVFYFTGHNNGTSWYSNYLMKSKIIMQFFLNIFKSKFVANTNKLYISP